MKRKRFMLGAVIVLMVVLVCAAAYAGHCSKKDTLPSAVMAAVESQYPQAKIEKVKQEEEGLDVYEVELEQGDKDIELTITEDGTIIEEEVEIAVEELPAAIQAALAGLKVEEAKKGIEYYAITLTKLDNPIVTYEVETKEGGKETVTEFSPDGTVLKQEVEEDDEHKGKCRGKHGDDDDDEDGDDDEDEDDEDDDDDEDKN